MHDIHARFLHFGMTYLVYGTEDKAFWDAPLAISHATLEIESDEHEDNDDDEGSWESIDSITRCVLFR